MKIYTLEKKVKDLDAPVRLYAFTDWHVGEKGCSHSAIERCVKRFDEDKGAMAITLGDLGGFITPSDKRFEPEAIDPSMTFSDLNDYGRVVVEKILSLAAPLKGRTIGCLIGNHEVTYMHRNHQDVGKMIAEGLGASCFGYSALIKMKFTDGKGRSKVYTVYATHGSGSSASYGGKLNRLVKTMGIAPTAHLVLMGHVHGSMSIEVPYLNHGGKKIGEHVQLGVVCGTTLRTYTEDALGYGERAGYHPTPLRQALVTITPSSGHFASSWV